MSSAYERNRRLVRFFDSRQGRVTPRDQETLEKLGGWIYGSATPKEQKQIDFFMDVRAFAKSCEQMQTGK